MRDDSVFIFVAAEADMPDIEAGLRREEVKELVEDAGVGKVKGILAAEDE
jgi:hypothetical protein